MTKKEILEKVRTEERKQIDEGILRGRISGYMKIHRYTKQGLKHFARVMLNYDVEV